MTAAAASVASVVENPELSGTPASSLETARRADDRHHLTVSTRGPRTAGPAVMIEAPDASAGAPRLSRVRLHHTCAQRASSGARGRDRPELRQSRQGQGRGVLPRVQRRCELRRLSRGDRRSGDRCRGHRRAAEVPSRSDVAGPAGGQARAGRKAGVPQPGGLSGGARGAGCRGGGRPRRRERPLQAARRPAAAPARRAAPSARWCSPIS